MYDSSTFFNYRSIWKLCFLKIDAMCGKFPRQVLLNYIDFSQKSEFSLHVLMGPTTCHSLNVLLTITFTKIFFVSAFCGIGTDPDTTLLRSAPDVLVGRAVELYTNLDWITVQVEDSFINLDPVSSSNCRIPQGHTSQPHPLPKTQSLSKYKAAVLVDKAAKQKLKKRHKNPPHNKRFCKLC